MSTISCDEIVPSRDGRVTSRNHQRLGYDRLTRGVYGHWPKVTDCDERQAQQARFLTYVRAVVEAYVSRDCALYGSTALQVMGVALPAAFQDWRTCHILTFGRGHRPERQGVCAHRASVLPSIRLVKDGLPLLHPVDHWLQLRGATDDEMVEVGDGLLRRRQPLLTMARLNQRLVELDGATGVKQARRVTRWLAENTDSLYETKTRMILVRAGLPSPVVNHPVYCPGAGRTYHVDMGYPVEKVAIEYDGAVHVGDRRQMDIDAARRRDLQDEGWMVITVTAAQLGHPDRLVRSVEAALVLRRSER